MLRNRKLLAGVVAGLVIGSCLTVKADGWLPNLNPFSSSSAPQKKTSSSSNPLRLPSLTGSPTSKPKSANGPTTWQKFSNGTKSAATKTKETLFPWTKKQPPQQSMLERYSVNDFRSQRKPEKKKSFLTGWMSSDEEQDRRPRSVTEFLSQPRPQ